MNASTYLQPKSRRTLVVLASVVAFHALLLVALQAGLHRTVTPKLPPVVQALLLEEKRPEPPAPAPAPAPTTPPPKNTPPPAYVPAPEVTAVVAPPNAIAAVTSAPHPVTAPAAPAPTAAPAVAPRAAPAARTAAGVNMAQCDKPEYPITSKRMEEEGTVTLRFLVGTDGKVIQSEIEKSSGYKRLDEAARAGLAKCQFRPAMADGKPEQAWTSIKYLWRLE